ncbi:putative acetyltransferase [Actinacidiphila reveromycinica]|uniref:Putative acetyltransferase n=1 Tax=Actinacidiphila reveromycinica TaxID=659352 RepID=A0A7U3V0N0_9ACTN|nr:GNAT family protein [Streptomyces sp. SN-593]BBB02188.1 putative acetyltransferase [Streptomyces sp. SN-593]
MLRGGKVGLRARHEDDYPVLRDEMYNDVVHSSRSSTNPWRPIPVGAKDPRLEAEGKDDSIVPFAVVDLTDDSLLGTASVWGIDRHNRCAHLGIGLRPAARGKGFGTDAVALLCHYGFVVRGLRRLQLETLADNTAMLRAAERNGFVREGVLRANAYVLGEILDEVVLGLLADEWPQPPPA